MRKLYYTLIIVVLLAACGKDNKEQSFQAQGTLTGFDPAMCACCGGIFLTIDNDPNQYRIHSLPGMTWHQMTSLQLPKRIEFDYTNPGTTCGLGQIIHITNYILH